MTDPQPSPLQRIQLQGRNYWIKRDDLLQPFPGNKARKLAGLQQRDLSNYRGLISHGGKQSNAMLALARFAQQRGLAFRYHTRPLPDWLRERPIGNLACALDLGMQLHESEQPPAPDASPPGFLFIPQGIAIPEAETGLRALAEELEQDIQQHDLRNPLIFLPSGTGTSAAWLNRHLPYPVVTTPLIAQRHWLREEMIGLLGSRQLPQIIDPALQLPFGRPDRRLLTIWQDLLKETGVEFDLLYDPIGWLTLSRLDYQGDIIYLHCGGIEGNSAMLARYHRLGWLPAELAKRIPVDAR